MVVDEPARGDGVVGEDLRGLVGVVVVAIHYYDCFV
jgi:hypothetical protein